MPFLVSVDKGIRVVIPKKHLSTIIAPDMSLEINQKLFDTVHNNDF